MATSGWNLDPPPGFHGLRPDLPMTFYYRHLPHWRQDGATYFVTFRLADSLPRSKLRQLEAMKREFEAKHGLRRTDWQSVPPHHRRTDWQSVPRKSVPRKSVPRKEWEAFTRTLMQQVEFWLDQGMGNCLLRRPDVSRIVADALQYSDNDSYELGCYVVMPNHVHAIVRPMRSEEIPLEKILQSRKRRTCREINRALGLQGTLWQEESFDRVIRDEEHLYRCIQYIGDNPRRAGLPAGASPRWIRPQWEACGWRFDTP